MHWKHVLAAVAAWFLILPPALGAPAASYVRYRTFELAGEADVVLVGTISSVSRKTFELEVERVIAGGDAPRAIAIERFEDWMCARRWDEYRRGQRVLLFLWRPTSKGKPFTILGAGGEGEMPLLGDDVLVRGYRVRGYPDGSYPVDGVEVEGASVALSELAHAVTGFRSTFGRREAGRTLRGQRVWHPLDPDVLEAYRSSSPTARHLVEELVSSDRWVEPSGPEPRTGRRGNLRCLEAVPLGFSGRARLRPGTRPDRFGTELSSGFGRALAYLGDLDGDGVGDLAVGAPGDSYTGHHHGALWILTMGADGGVRRSVEIRAGRAGFPDSMNEFAALGSAVAALGDLDGDGVPDLAVGAPGWDGAQEGCGGIWILFLRADGTARRVVEVGSDPELLAAGGGPDHGLGAALACLGDLDGDGSVELAIGQSPGFDLGLEQGRRVLIASLAPDGDVLAARGISDRAPGFELRYSWFGRALAAFGDLDGDGIGELAVGDPRDDDGGGVRGAVWIVFLDERLEVRARKKVSDWSGDFEGPLRDWSTFGKALSPAGDLDGDGVPDLLVSSSEGLWTLFLDRSGSVVRHRLVRGPEGGFTDLGTLGTAIAAGSRGRGEAGLPIAVGGTVGRVEPGTGSGPSFARTRLEPGGEETVAWAVWLVRVGPTGAIEPR